MGYTTDFEGHFTPDKPLRPEHVAYLRAFASTRRVTRNAKLTALRPDPVRVAAGLPLGPGTNPEAGDAPYFVGETGYAGQDAGHDVIAHNSPPPGQPGLWCHWTVDDDGNIAWDTGEKFYEYVAWIQYLIDNFLMPWGYKLNGKVTWIGDNADDRGLIQIYQNKVTVKGRVVYD